VIAGTPAWKAGIRSGDIILSLNGRRVFRRSDLEDSFPAYFQTLEVEYLHGREERYRRETVALGGFEAAGGFGVLPVPEGTEGMYTELSTAGPLKRWGERLFSRFRR
ncbi:MAG: PDZ domain-containing protein, partial [Desulfotomaculales bacterium]